MSASFFFGKGALARRLLLPTLLTLLCAPALAQWRASDDWQEGEAPPPPTFSTDHLIGVLVSVHSELRFGVDPDTIRIGDDDVVRYVLVARSGSGAFNAVYEGLRCNGARVKTYARWQAGNPGTWKVDANAAWRDLEDPSPTRHAQRLYKAGMCDGDAINRPLDHMLRELRRNAPLS